MSRRRRLLAVISAVAGTVAIGIGLVLTVGSSSANTTGSSSYPAVSLTETQVKQVALAFAAANGDATPTSIQHVLSTRQQAVFAASEDVVPSSTEVYLIVERGSFVGENAPRPPGAAAPTGSVLTLIIDASTGQVTDFGIQNNVPDLSALGPVTTDQ